MTNRSRKADASLADLRRRLLRRRLLRWYGREKRDLPWRRTSDPYRIWVSEIMLQQTRVEAVIPYYEKFLRNFPTLRTLARAREERVLASWSGLGYYSRARHLHRAAKIISLEHGGEFPREETAARALPGVGRYSAAAVLSIAYGAPLAVLDGNVARVLSRLDAVKADIRNGKDREALWQRAQEMLDPRCPGDFNQAMMELGATVCTPRQPRCGKCPLAKDCKAYQQDAVEKYPPARKRAPEKRLRWIAAIAQDAAGRCLLQRRPRNAAWLAGFWELPMWERDASDEARGRLQLIRRLGGLRHTITGHRLEVEVWQAAASHAPDNNHNTRWASPSAIAKLAATTITRKALALSAQSSAEPSRR